MNRSLLKRKLEYHYKKFDYSQIFPDPLIFPHRFKRNSDIEISAFVSSIFAYGTVKQIINSLEKIHTLFGNNPTEFIQSFNKKENKQFFNHFKHRFYTGNDTIILFMILKKVITKYGSLKKMFLQTDINKYPNIKQPLGNFSNKLLNLISKTSDISKGVKFMFPNPEDGSACKRMNLFLRWMIRKDELDFGLWNEIPTGKLIIPVDTHIAKISRKIGLTKSKTVNWKMAEEITENLKKFDSVDPVKYDFAICHIGMRRQEF